MNILLSMPRDNQSNDYIIDAFHDMGHDVIFVDHRQNLERAKQIIENIILHKRIDLFLCLYLVPGHTYDRDFLDLIKTRSPNTKFCSWLFDATIEGKISSDNEEFINIVKEYDYFFTVCGGLVESFRNKGVNAYFCQEGVTKYVRDLNSNFEKKYDISFIGQIGHATVHSARLPLLKFLSKKIENIVVYGFYDAQNNYDEDVVKIHKFRPTYNDIDHSRIVAQSKINLCHSGWSDIDGYFSARNYRVMGSGGFVLANRSKNISGFFVEDEDIVLYDNFEECYKKAKYYIAHDEEREKIAMSGKSKVLTKYTFNHSINSMFDIIFKT